MKNVLFLTFKKSFKKNVFSKRFFKKTFKKYYFSKLDLDFGMPDPYPKDGTGRFAHVGRTCVAHVWRSSRLFRVSRFMFGKMCYLNTLHKCLARCILWIPYINVWQDVPSEYFSECHALCLARCVIWIPYINVWQDAFSEYLTSMFGKMCHLNTLIRHKAWHWEKLKYRT